MDITFCDFAIKFVP